MSVFDNVAFSLSLRSGSGDVAAKVRRALDAVHMASFEDRYPGAALGRPAAARRRGPRHGGRAAPPAARRAALGARPQDARPPAARAQGSAAPPRHRLRLRHARPGGGLRPVRHDPRDERGTDRAVRRARDGLPPPGRRLRGRLHRRRDAGAGARGRVAEARATIRTALGTFEAPGQPALDQGMPAALVLRPDSIVVGTAATPCRPPCGTSPSRARAMRSRPRRRACAPLRGRHAPAGRRHRAAVGARRTGLRDGAA